MASGMNEFVEVNAFGEASIQAIKAASVFMSAIPMIIAYPLIQKYFTKGTLLEASKGKNNGYQFSLRRNLMKENFMKVSAFIALVLCLTVPAFANGTKDDGKKTATAAGPVSIELWYGAAVTEAGPPPRRLESSADG